MSCADRTAKDGSADITKKCDAVSVAFAGETPYVIPMSFGFEWAGEGEKVSSMRQVVPRGCFRACDRCATGATGVLRSAR